MKAIKKDYFLLVSIGVILIVGLIWWLNIKDINLNKETSYITFEEINHSKLDKLNGKEVKIEGYVLASSNVSDDYLYLTRLPYQTNYITSEDKTSLSSTIPFKLINKSNSHLGNFVSIEGTLVVENSKTKDENNLNYSYRLENVNIVQTRESVSANVKLFNGLDSNYIFSSMTDIITHLALLSTDKSTNEVDTKNILSAYDKLVKIQSDYKEDENYSKLLSDADKIATDLINLSNEANESLKAKKKSIVDKEELNTIVNKFNTYLTNFSVD